MGRQNACAEILGRGTDRSGKGGDRLGRFGAVRREERCFLKEKAPGREQGCRFSVSPLAVLPFLCFALLNRGPLFPCACLAALLHELGHLAAIRLCGGRVVKFALYPFGAEIVIGYLVGIEYAVKNLRILLMAKETGADDATIGGRLRENYV